VDVYGALLGLPWRTSEIQTCVKADRSNRKRFKRDDCGLGTAYAAPFFAIYLPSNATVSRRDDPPDNHRPVWCVPRLQQGERFFSPATNENSAPTILRDYDMTGCLEKLHVSNKQTLANYLKWARLQLLARGGSPKVGEPADLYKPLIILFSTSNY
jgi:hypothetical protein